MSTYQTKKRIYEMYDLLPFFSCARIGLMLNFVGTIMMAFSIGKSTVGTEEVDDKGRHVSTASFRHPTLFRTGILVLSAGFMISLISC